MKVGDLVIGINPGFRKTPGVLVEVVDSNAFGGDAIVTVLWAGQTRVLHTTKSRLRKINKTCKSVI